MKWTAIVSGGSPPAGGGAPPPLVARRPQPSFQLLAGALPEGSQALVANVIRPFDEALRVGGGDAVLVEAHPTWDRAGDLKDVAGDSKDVATGDYRREALVCLVNAVGTALALLGGGIDDAAVAD